MSVTDTSTALRTDVLGLFAARRRMSFLVPGVILAYLIYIFFAFDIPGLAQRARMDNAAILMSDFWIHKTHVTRDNRTGAVTVSIDGEVRATYPAGRMRA
jgi:phosphonate transport system permease protein